jgi:Flp pilus assembly protein TadB
VYVAYLGGFVVIVVGLIGAGVVVMWVVVMRHGRSCFQVMITLEAVVAVVVLPIAGGVPMRRLPSLRLV